MKEGFQIFLTKARLFAVVVFLVAFTGALALAGGPSVGLYAVLVVPNDAAPEVIKSAWKKLVLQYHPDRFIGDALAVQAATEKLKRINAAETILGDPVLRAYYDQLSNYGQNHANWERIPGNSNAEALIKRFGPPQTKKSNPAEVAAWAKAAWSKANAQTSPPPPEEPTAQPKPDENIWDSLKIFEFFADSSIAYQDWRDVYVGYATAVSRETDLERQYTLLTLLKKPLDYWKKEWLAQAIINKFKISDPRISSAMRQLIDSPVADYRRVGVTLLQVALLKDQTWEILNLSSTEARRILISRMNDSSAVVRVTAEQALTRLDARKFSATTRKCEAIFN